MAIELKKHFPDAVEQTTSQKLYEEQDKGQGWRRRKWQRGDSDHKTHGKAMAQRGQWRMKRSRDSDWQDKGQVWTSGWNADCEEGWASGWDAGWQDGEC